MSDEAPGPGWWRDVDGTWHPPADGRPVPSGEWPAPGASADPASHLWTPPPPSPPAADPTAALPPVGVVPPAELPHRTLAERSGVHYPDRPPVVPGQRPPTDWPMPEDEPLPGLGPVPAGHRIAGAVALIAGLVIVAATFAPWATFGGDVITGHVHGWDRDDGIITLGCGAVAAAIGAMLAGGLRSVFLKLGLVASGVVGLAVMVIDALDIGRENDLYAPQGVAVSVGWGLWLIGLASVVVIVAAVVERSPWSVGATR